MTNPLEPTTPSNFIGFLQWVNDLSSGVMIPGFLFSLLIIIFYKSSDNTPDRFLSSSLFIAIIATLLKSAGLLNDLFLVIFWVIAGLAVMYSIWRRDN